MEVARTNRVELIKSLRKGIILTQTELASKLGASFVSANRSGKEICMTVAKDKCELINKNKWWRICYA